MAKSGVDDEPNAFIGKVDNKSQPRNPKFLVAALIIVIVLALGGWLYWRKVNGVQTGNCAHKTNQACKVLKLAVSQLDASNVQDLSSTVTNIQTLKHYDKDPNLLLVMVTYYMDTSDPDSANKYLTMLKRVYNPKKAYDPVLVTYALTPDQLATAIKSLQQTQAASNANIEGIKQDGTTVHAGASQ